MTPTILKDMTHDPNFIKGTGAMLAAGAVSTLPTVDVVIQWGQAGLIAVSLCYGIHKWLRSIKQQKHEERQYDHEERTWKAQEERNTDEKK